MFCIGPIRGQNILVELTLFDQSYGGQNSLTVKIKTGEVFSVEECSERIEPHTPHSSLIISA